jgi:threonine aldolase
MTAASSEIIDLRSDTVTQPTAAMRAAMAQAPVGDDVFDEDPSVHRLQEAVAALLGTEAALFVPSGTMANQIAIRLHTRPGDEMLAGASAHTWLYESGAAAALSGVQTGLLPGDGRFTGADLRAHHKPGNEHTPATRLVAVENSHNMGGGLVWPAEQLAEVLSTARALGLATHLDGARLWNAAVSSGRSERDLAAGFDTVSVCLSKGLGAPVGSLLCGSRRLMQQARRIRKMYGGGMRQAGILAAAGLHALEHHRTRLVEDHHNARLLAEALAALPAFSVELERVHSNIVIAELDAGWGPAAALEAAASSRGLRLLAVGPQRIRLVTHLDVDRRACQRAAELLAGLTAQPARD